MRHQRFGVGFPAKGSCTRNYGLARRWRGEQFVDSFCDGTSIALGHQAICRLGEQFLRTRDRRGDHRCAAGERFNPRVGKALATGWEHEHIGRAENHRQVIVRNRTKEADPVNHAHSRGGKAKFCFVGTTTGQQQHGTRELGKGLDCVCLTLAFDQRADTDKH